MMIMIKIIHQCHISKVIVKFDLNIKSTTNTVSCSESSRTKPQALHGSSLCEVTNQPTLVNSVITSSIPLLFNYQSNQQWVIFISKN